MVAKMAFVRFWKQNKFGGGQLPATCLIVGLAGLYACVYV